MSKQGFQIRNLRKALKKSGEEMFRCILPDKSVITGIQEQIVEEYEQILQDWGEIPFTVRRDGGEVIVKFGK